MMVEVVLYFVLLLLGSTVIVLALNLSYVFGQRFEERKARRYLQSLTHLYRPDDHDKRLP
jgi:hypothetical protein